MMIDDEEEEEKKREMPKNKNRRRERRKLLCEANFLARSALRKEDNSIFPRNLPSRFLLIQFIRNPILLESHHNITLNRPQTRHRRCTRQTRHRSNRHIKRRRSRSSTIIRQLAMIQITLKHHQIALTQM